MLDGKRYFSMEQISEAANIEAHLSYLEEVSSKYEWDNKTKEDIDRRLNYIRHKLKDKNLNVAIIGEFSNGKSTFINALLRDNLLQSDIIQGTTVSSTVIKYGHELDVIVNYNSGDPVSINQSIELLSIEDNALKRERIRSYITEITTDVKAAESIRSVVIQHPSSVLKEGLVIIDTPGTNAEIWHEEVTRKTIEEFADATILLTSADKPLPQTMIDFVNANLKDVISKCIFIITKIDLIREKERERQLMYIKQRLKTAFDIEEPHLYLYSPVFVLGEIVPDICNGISISESDRKNLVNESYTTETQIYRFLHEQRVIMQLQKLVLLINTLFSSIQENMENISAAYKRRHDALEKNRIQDLKTFVFHQKIKHSDNVYADCQRIKQDRYNYINALNEGVLSSLKDDVYSAKGQVELKKIVSHKPNEIMVKVHKGINTNLKRCHEEIRKVMSMELDRFLLEFQKLYNSLASLDGNLDDVEDRNLQIKGNQGALSTYSSNISRLILEKDKGEKKMVGGGAAAGAVLGTMIFPGVGTVVGGILGGAFGVFLTSSLDEAKKKYWSNIENSTNELFKDIHAKVVLQVDRMIDEESKKMEGVIEEYYKEYGILVNEMVKRDENEKKQIKEKIHMIDKDLEQLANRKLVIESIKSHLFEL